MSKSTKVKAPTATNAEEIIKHLEEPVSESVVAWVEGFKEDFDKQIEEVAPSPAFSEEKTEQQRILDYIANSHSDKVDLAPLLKSLYPLPSYSEPAIYLQQGESKRLRGVLIDMAAKGEVVFEDETYLKLGKNHWLDADAKTKSWNIDTLKIVAKKNS